MILYQRTRHRPYFSDKLVTEEREDLTPRWLWSLCPAALLAQCYGTLPLHDPACSFLVKEVQANHKVLGFPGSAQVVGVSPSLQP